MPSRRWAAGAVAAALGAGAVTGYWYLTRPPATVAAAGPTTGLARVVRTDLVTTQPVGGTIGYGPITTLTTGGGTTPAALATAQAAVSTTSQKLAADRQAASDQAAVNQQAINQAQATLNSDQQAQQRDCASAATATACAADQAKVSADQATLGSTQAQAQQKLNQANAAVSADQVALANANTELQPLQSQVVHGTMYTGLPAVGAVIAQGQALYSVDGHSVPLFYGPVSLYRMLTYGVSGADVQQLEQDLIQLGFANSSNLTVDGSFTDADAAAVRRWQASIGVAQTGSVALGDLVFLDGAVRVAAVHVAKGAPVQAGQAVLDLTGATRLVTVNLNPSLAFSVKQGDPVSVNLPDGKTKTPGVVASVSTVATQTQSTAQTQNGAPQSVIPVTIALTNPSQVPDLDAAPVTVDVTTQSAKGVLAVPVNALLALEGGGYALEVPNAGGHGTRLITVQTGIFDNSQVEVSGPGLVEGMSVVVPT